MKTTNSFAQVVDFRMRNASVNSLYPPGFSLFNVFTYYYSILCYYLPKINSCRTVVDDREYQLKLCILYLKNV